MVKVQSRFMTEGGEEINIGGNASAEATEDEGVDDTKVTVDAIEHTFHLQAFDMDKATLKGWLKNYFQSIRKSKKDAGVAQEDIKAFMAGAPDAAKFLLSKASELEMFINEDFDEKGAVCFREWSQQGNIYYYIKDGLSIKKC